MTLAMLSAQPIVRGILGFVRMLLMLTEMFIISFCLGNISRFSTVKQHDSPREND